MCYQCFDPLFFFLVTTEVATHRYLYDPELLPVLFVVMHIVFALFFTCGLQCHLAPVWLIFRYDQHHGYMLTMFMWPLSALRGVALFFF